MHALGGVAAAQPSARAKEPVVEVPAQQPAPSVLDPAKRPLRPPTPPRPLRGAWFELKAGVGAAFGGDEVPDPSGGLDAGDGVAFTLGAAVTPLWHCPFGVGLGLDAGFKYFALFDVGGGYELRRVPIVGSAHMLVAVDERWFLIAAGGPYLELAIKASGTGSAAAEPDVYYPAALGFMGEAGALYAAGHLGVDLTLRYTGIRYDGPAGAADADASSFGLYVAVHWFL